MGESKLNEVLSLRSFNSTNQINKQLAKTFTCPHCGSIVYVKNGKNNNTQRYLCKICHKSFIELTNTVIYRTKKDINTWTQFLNCLIKQFSLRRCAKELNISLNTAFYWRHKILDALREHSKTEELSGTITIHETYLRRCFKGNHTNSDFSIPRKPRIRGNAMNYEWISHEHVCILSAIDSNNNLLMEPVCFNHLMTPDLVRVLVPIIEPSSKLITDRRYTYQSFCGKLKYQHNKVYNNPTPMCKYSLRIINDLHKILKIFLRVYKGVATKYLSNYLTLFKYIRNNKICKFTRNIPIYDNRYKNLFNKNLILFLRGDSPYFNSNCPSRKAINV